MTVKTLEQTLMQRKVIVTCGTGGVGKTTLSAVLAIRAAFLGRKSIVVTIDPAKRLATSLGIDSLGDHAVDLSAAIQAARQQNNIPSNNDRSEDLSFHALMPDTRKTLETFFRSLSPSATLAEKMIKNPIFEVFAREFSGANEYMALERLDALVQAKNYDLIVLDTPPSRNTLTFLKAPQLLSKVFEERLLRWLIAPNKWLANGMKKGLDVLENLTGQGFINHLVEFAHGLLEMQDGFMQKLKRVSDLLQSQDLGFVMVSAPHPDTVPELRYFMDAIENSQMQFDGLILNRTLGGFPVLSDEIKNADPATRRALELLQFRQAAEKEVLGLLSSRLQTTTKGAQPFCFLIPELTRDIHSLEDLLHVSTTLDAHSLDH